MTLKKLLRPGLLALAALVAVAFLVEPSLAHADCGVDGTFRSFENMRALVPP